MPSGVRWRCFDNVEKFIHETRSNVWLEIDNNQVVNVHFRDVHLRPWHFAYDRREQRDRLIYNPELAAKEILSFIEYKLKGIGAYETA